MAKVIVRGLNFYADRTRVAAVVFSDEGSIKFTFNDFTDQQSVLIALSFTTSPGRTNTADALGKAADGVFTAAAGNRVGVDDTIILITDGNSNINAEDTLTKAEMLHQRGVRIIGVGLGQAINHAELEAVSSSPASENVFYLTSEEHVPEATNAILDSLCGV